MIDTPCPCCGATRALVEARRRVALSVKAKYASDILDGAWDDMPVIRKTLSEVRHEALVAESGETDAAVD